jgi:acyl-CoA hydrolase/GNAT superfamily N-acetyltransferase
MTINRDDRWLEKAKEAYPEKFVSEGRVFRHVRRGDHIFIGTGCGEPQYLVKALISYVESHPTAIFDAEVFQVWTLGVAPYADAKFKHNFRHNSFFVGYHTRDAVNRGMADYTPVFLSRIPELIRRHLIPIDVALIQVSPPDQHGHLSLGISVDITLAAITHAKLVIAQVNNHMPRVHGDGFIHLKDVDFIIPYDEPLLEYHPGTDPEVAQKIGAHMARLVEDGDTLQVGYGMLPNAILDALSNKKHLGIHTELLSDGIVKLMKSGVVDNTRKTANPGRTVATFCMGSRETYEYVHNNLTIEFRPADYTNNPLVIARHDNIVAINAALQIDLTGQATAESVEGIFYSGIGGMADFMRGAVLARNGKTILALPSTTADERISRIVPFLAEGDGITLNRGDVKYVVTEYGIAYISGKNIRERAMELIAIAHPKFRSWLIERAKELNLIYKDQAFIPGKRGEYPEHLETYRTTKTGLELRLRPVKISDEPLLKDFWYSLSDESLYRRFISSRKDIPHERLQEFVIIDYTSDMIILAELAQEDVAEKMVVGIGQYNIDEMTHTAELSFAIRDEYQGQGVGTELVTYLAYLGRKRGLLGFTATVLLENKPMLYLFEKIFDVERSYRAGEYELKMAVKRETAKLLAEPSRLRTLKSE